MLIFIAGKIFYAQIWGKLDPAISLAVTFTLIVSGIAFSLMRSDANRWATSTGKA